MNLNATLISELFIFGIFLAIVQVYIWPRFMDILEERRQMIIKAQKDAQKTEDALNEAQAQAQKILQDAKEQSQRLVQSAQQRANEIEFQAKENVAKTLEHAKTQAQEEKEKVHKQFLNEAKAHYADLISQALTQVKKEPVSTEYSQSLLETMAKESA